MTDVIIVVPVIDHKMRGMCKMPYPGHPHGCPNFGVAERCPPKAPCFEDVVDLSKTVYAICNSFDFAKHVEKMRIAHPTWTERQLRNCLYWQGTARKTWRWKIKSFLAEHPGLVAFETPEACGVDITTTMKAVGVVLEWPPQKVAMQVALAGSPR